MSAPKSQTVRPEVSTSGRSPVEALRGAGPLLFGEFWQSAAARQLGVTDRSVRHWLAGTRTPPERIVVELENALLERLQAIRQHLKRGA